MDKIYQCEDSIEQVKFMLAALKIQTAFSVLHDFTTKKQINHYQTFLYKLSIHSNQQLLLKCQLCQENLFDTIVKMQERRIRNAFYKMVCIWEKEERRYSSRAQSSKDIMRSSDERSEVEYSGIKAMSLIEEEGWKDKMTLEELQASCEYYAVKIKEVEKSFSNFFLKVKQEE